MGVVLGWALWRWRGRTPGALATRPGSWIALAVASLLSHAIADAFTSYGTLLLWPLRRRFAWDALPIVDLLFSATLLLAVTAGGLRRRAPRLARASALGALAFCAAWEAYGLDLNRRAEQEARRQLAVAGIQADVHAYPVLLQPWLRRLVARDGAAGILGVGWISTWRPSPIQWHLFRPATGPAVEAARRRDEVRLFEWFAMGQTTARVRAGDPGAIVELDDLRYGHPADPEHGLWGVRVEVGANGEALGEVRRIRRPPDGRLTLRWLWSATFVNEQGGASGAPP
jgi:inner membrane protein